MPLKIRRQLHDNQASKEGVNETAFFLRAHQLAHALIAVGAHGYYPAQSIFYR